MSEKLEILCIYRSGLGREVSFDVLSKGTDALDEDEYNIKSFWQVTGGFSVTRNGHNTIYNNTDFYNMYKAVSFLLESLYWINGKTYEKFDKDDEFPDCVIHRAPFSGDITKLKKGANGIVLSYLPKNNFVTYKRGTRYFDNELFNTSEWEQEVNIALGEYFQVFTRVIELTDNLETLDISPQLNYLKAWEAIKLK